MSKPSKQTGSCPVCATPVDPLRAGAVGIFDETFVYFCSDACRSTFAGARASPGHRLRRGSEGSPAASGAGTNVLRTGPLADAPVVAATTSESRGLAAARADSTETAAGPRTEPAERDGLGPAPAVRPRTEELRRPVADEPPETKGETHLPREIGVPPVGPTDTPLEEIEEGAEAEPHDLKLAAYGWPEESPTRSASITPTVLLIYLLVVVALAASHFAQPWFPWIELADWLPDMVAAAGTALLVVLGLVDLLCRRGRGMDHVVVGFACAALVLVSRTEGWPTWAPPALVVLAVYSASVVAERRLLAQRPSPLAAAQEGPPADAVVDWGGPRGPLLRALRLALALSPFLPLAAAVAAVAWAALAGQAASSEAMVPVLTGSALAFLPWSIRHAGLVLGDLCRAASAANIRYQDPATVERAAQAHHLVFLYRGVVTHGRPEVVEFINYSELSDAVILDLVGSAERAAGGSSLSEALLAFTQRRGASGEVTTRLSRYWPGHGVKATSARGEVWIGGRRMLLEEGVSTAAVEEDARHFEQAGHTVLFVVLKRRVHAIVVLADPLRPEMEEATDQAHRHGMETHLLTSESRATAEHVARLTRVRHIRPELTGEEQAAEIRGLRELGAAVAVVGRPGGPAQATQDVDVAVAIGVPDPHGVPCNVAVAANDPRVAVASLIEARRAVTAVWLHVVAAAGVALLNAGLASLGFLPPGATMAVVALVALAPLLRRRRFNFAASAAPR